MENTKQSDPPNIQLSLIQKGKIPYLAMLTFFLVISTADNTSCYKYVCDLLYANIAGIKCVSLSILQRPFMF